MTSWMLHHPDDLDDEQRLQLQQVRATCPHLDATAGHVGVFADILTGRHGERLDAWMAAVEADDLPYLHRFVRGLRLDYDAVLNGLTLSHSSAPTSEPVKVGVHDFADPALGKAVPYGVYDLAANAGWVNVGCDHDTAAFAVESIRRWWNGQGRHTYPRATRLLITADAGGSNGYRVRAWKIELATLAAQTGLTITVCHLPPGTSKWNQIEHRLFSHITMNWRGRPLTSHEVIVATIAATTTRTGLRVHAELDTGSYPTGIQIGDADMAGLPITQHAFHGDWNYVLHPTLAGSTPAGDTQPSPARWSQRMLSDPTLTGMSRKHLDSLTAALAELHHAQPGAGLGRPPTLCFSHQVLAAVLHFRLALPAEPLAVLFGSSRAAVHRTFHKIKRLLDQHGTTISPAASPPAALAALHARALALGDPPTNKIKSAC